MNWYKFLIFLLILILSVLSQARFNQFFGWTPDFVLIALITLSFFAELAELLFLILLGILLLNWQPIFSPEIFLLAVIPLIAFFVKNRLPYRPWLNNLILIFFAIFVFYFSASGFLFLDNSVIFIQELTACLLGGWILFAVLKNIKIGHKWL